MQSGISLIRPQPRGLTQLLALIVLLVFASLAQAVTEPVKSPNDSNRYRYLELDNGLQVLLISAPGSTKAAASMNVAVGSGDDPKNREGLSHFLEHMLFLGTEKYPEPGEYQQFIKSHGGSHNAFTAFQDTNYFFDIQAGHLDDALDRFAEQFSAPLFTPELVDRERRAVHSEYTSKLKDDGRRIYSVKKAVSNPDHTFHQFAVGNLETLENTDARPLRPDLVEFWKAHYSANLMSLAVYGPQPLDELEAMVRGRFDAIENRDLAAKVHDAPLMRPEALPAQVTVDALKDIRSLTLSFPIPSQQANYRTKPGSYVANLLGHEGPGSLFDVLKQEGLVESLSAGTGMDTGTEATLEIAMSLTPEGLERRDEILALVFAYIEQIRDEGISEDRFNEMKNLAQIDFRFRERSEPVHEVMRLASQLRHYPPADVLQAPWMMEAYEPAQYRDILARLTPDNVLVTVVAPEPGIESPSQTQWYQTAYERQPLDIPSVNEADTAGLAAQLALPDANPFVPESLGMVSGNTMSKPVLLSQQEGLSVWYARDTQFGTPKANVYVSIRTPLAQASARGKVLTELLVDAVNTNLNAWAYPAQLAGLDYSVYSHLRGVTIRVGGYSDKLHLLMTRILSQVSDPHLTQQRFDIARQRMIDGLLNKAKERPVQQTSEKVQTLLIEGAWNTEERLAAAREVTLDELERFAAELFSQTDPVMLAHGNLTEAAALNLAQQIRAMVLQQAAITDVPRSKVRALPKTETVVPLTVDHPDTGYTLYMQGRHDGFDERAAFRLLGQIISSPFYEEIRTNRQLGYIVYATPFEMLEMPALGLVVQSPEASAQEIDQAIAEFSSDFEETLSDLSDTELEREKQAVISKLKEQERTLGEISERFWREIDRGATDFDSRERLVEAVKAVDQEQLLDIYRSAALERHRALQVITTPPDEETAASPQARPRPSEAPAS
ncbi:peptidase M16 [Marinobacter lipolyticus]|uniref:insulinase family protein n=1 Tax=Marinobacter lipolyticus TaxID=209639 RepID=UPI001BCF5958|nr:insulinase family protein [Marinobacter lipolyticus]MBS8239767.1 peptidase M16 [Marinobacter lipolyticus]